MAEFQEVEMGGIIYEFPVDMADDQIQTVLMQERDATAEQPRDLSSVAALTPPAEGEQTKDDVIRIIRDAATTVGIRPDWAVAIAKTEAKDLSPDSKNPRSSASGLFQFTDETWKESVGKWGKKHSVLDDDVFDANSNSVMGAEFTKSNMEKLSKLLGREPTLSEVYLAHFSGFTGASKVLSKIKDNPNVLASEVWSKKAQEQNPTIFKEGIKASEVVQLLTRRVRNNFTPDEVDEA